MKSLPLGALLLVLALGTASGAVTSFLLAPQSAPQQQASATPDLTRELGELREQIAMLSDRLEGVELSPVLPQRAPAQAGTDPAFEEEVRAFMEKAGEAEGTVPLALQSKVEDALFSIREQEKFEQDQVKLQRRDEFIAGTVAKIAPGLSLSPDQTDQMREVWTRKAEADRELGRLWNEGLLDSDSAGETKRQNEEQHQADLQGFLSAQQYEDYTSLVSSWGRGAEGK